MQKALPFFIKHVDLESVLTAAFGAIYRWEERAAQRRHLATLDDRLLQDIGLSRLDVDREARKPFWQS
jgi:uncharacterized protein YjiS (DUF1127 family)